MKFELAKNMNNDKILELNWLRGFAALCVVLYHFTTRYEEVFGHKEIWSIDFSWGCGAVNAFFILSGFLTAMTLKPNTLAIDYLKKKSGKALPYILGLHYDYEFQYAHSIA